MSLLQTIGQRSMDLLRYGEEKVSHGAHAVLSSTTEFSKEIIQDVGLDKAVEEKHSGFWGSLASAANISARFAAIPFDISCRVEISEAKGLVKGYKLVTDFEDRLNTSWANSEYVAEAKETPSLVSKYPLAFKKLARVAQIGYDVAQIGGGIASIFEMVADGAATTALGATAATEGIAAPALAATVGNSIFWTGMQVGLSTLALEFEHTEAVLDTWIATASGSSSDKVTAIDRWKSVNKDSVLLIISAAQAAIKLGGMLNQLVTDLSRESGALKTIEGATEAATVTHPFLLEKIQQTFQWGQEISTKISSFTKPFTDFIEPFKKAKDFSGSIIDIATRTADIVGINLPKILHDHSVSGWNWLKRKGTKAGDAIEAFLSPLVSTTKPKLSDKSIASTLKEGAEICSYISGVTAVPALALSLTGIGLPVSGTLGVISTVFALGQAMMEWAGWFALKDGVSKGAIDPKEVTSERNQAAFDTALLGFGTVIDKLTSAARLVAEGKASTEVLENISGAENSVEDLPKSIRWLNDLTPKLDKFLHLDLSPIKEDPELAKRLKSLEKLKSAANLLFTFASLGIVGAKRILGYAKSIAKGAKSTGLAAFDLSKNIVQSVSRTVAAESSQLWQKGLSFASESTKYLAASTASLSKALLPKNLQPAFSGIEFQPSVTQPAGYWARNKMEVPIAHQPIASTTPKKRGRRSHRNHPLHDPKKLHESLLKEEGQGFSPESSVRSKLGNHLNFDPGDARFHIGATSASIARSLGAEAFTIGRDVYFGADRYQPNDSRGLGLIAHELVHVGQQHSKHDAPRFYSKIGGDTMESEARAVEKAVVHGYARSFGFEQFEEILELNDEGESPDLERIRQIRSRMLALVEEGLPTGGSYANISNIEISISLNLATQNDEEAATVWASAVLSAIGSPKPIELLIPTLSRIQRASSAVCNKPQSTDSSHKDPEPEVEQDQKIAGMTGLDRILLMVEESKDQLGPEGYATLKGIIKSKWTYLLGGIGLAAQFFPGTWIVDAAAGAFAFSIGYGMGVGFQELTEAISTAYRATTQHEIESASKEFVDAAIALGLATAGARAMMARATIISDSAAKIEVRPPLAIPKTVDEGIPEFVRSASKPLTEKITESVNPSSKIEATQDSGQLNAEALQRWLKRNPTKTPEDFIQVWKSNTNVEYRKVVKPVQIYRVFTKGKTSAEGIWATIEDVTSMSADQIRRILSLPYKPTHYVIMELPVGSSFEYGQALGGGIQLRIKNSQPTISKPIPITD